MTETLDHLRTRRTIPAAFLGEPGPDAAQLREILTIAARVPDHGKLAPWRFIVFEGAARGEAGRLLLEQRLRHEPDLSESERAAELGRFTKAPLVVAVVSHVTPEHRKATELEQILSAGAVAMNLLHAAHALGFAGQWVTERPATDPEAGRLLGLGEHERIVGFIHIGTPTVPPQERPRPDVDTLITRWAPPSP